MERLIKNDLGIMLNCLLVEKRRIQNLKNIIVRDQRYEYAAMIRDIEIKLDELILKIQK